MEVIKEYVLGCLGILIQSLFEKLNNNTLILGVFFLFLFLNFSDLSDDP